MRARIVKIMGLCATVVHMVFTCGAAWAIYGVRIADLSRTPLPLNPIKTWGKVTSISPLKISDGRNEIVVTGLTSRMNDFVVVAGNWDGLILNVVGSGQIISRPSNTEMIYIPAGSFLMGNSGIGNDVTYGNLNGSPQHYETLSEYYIGKYEVTRGEYRKFINAGGYYNQYYWSDVGWSWKVSHNRTQPEYWDAVQNWRTPPGSFTQTDNHPVVGVTYYEAEAFCKWAGGRLPTEAEWERAARWNPSTSHPNVYPWGDTWDINYCNNWWDYLYRGDQTSPVGSYSSYGSPSGCQDMAGNVWEWCADWYKSYPGSIQPFDYTNVYRVLRGGSWAGTDDRYTSGRDCRCAYRLGYGNYLPYNYFKDAGFRLAR